MWKSSNKITKRSALFFSRPRRILRAWELIKKQYRFGARAELVSRCMLVMMKVRLFMTVFKNYSRLGACMHTANHPEGDTPREHACAGSPRSPSLHYALGPCPDCGVFLSCLPAPLFLHCPTCIPVIYAPLVVTVQFDVTRGVCAQQAL